MLPPISFWKGNQQFAYEKYMAIIIMILEKPHCTVPKFINAQKLNLCMIEWLAATNIDWGDQVWTYFYNRQIFLKRKIPQAFPTWKILPTFPVLEIPAYCHKHFEWTTHRTVPHCMNAHIFINSMIHWSASTNISCGEQVWNNYINMH